MNQWMDMLEQIFVNGELQVIAAEIQDEIVDAQWDDLIGMQFLEMQDVYLYGV